MSKDASPPRPPPLPGPKSLAYADAWVDKLSQSLPLAANWDADAVHHSRVATRRLRAALDVVAPVVAKPHRKPLERMLRKLRHQLGPLRDLDVMLDGLEDFRPGPGVDWLRQRWTDERTRRRRKTADGLHPGRSLAKLGHWWALRPEWAEAAGTVDRLLADSVHLQLDAFVELATTSGADPHAVRIAGKALRYTLEMAVESGHPLPPSVARAFKRMQDALGAWHDMVVLADHAMTAAVDAELALHEAATTLAVLDVVRTAVQRSQRHLAAFHVLWARQGATLVETVRVALPLAVTESRTGPDRPATADTSGPALRPEVDPVAG